MTTDSTELDAIPSDSDENSSEPAGVGTYAEMFAQYEESQKSWIGPAEIPLVFHVRKLCAELDKRVGAGAEVKAAQWSSYLQAIERLEKRRPKPAGPSGPRGDGLEPAGSQASLFEAMD